MLARGVNRTLLANSVQLEAGTLRMNGYRPTEKARPQPPRSPCVSALPPTVSDDDFLNLAQ